MFHFYNKKDDSTDQDSTDRDSTYQDSPELDSTQYDSNSVAVPQPQTGLVNAVHCDNGSKHNVHSTLSVLDVKIDPTLGFQVNISHYRKPLNI